MIYPDEAMLYAPVEWHDCSEGFEDIRYEKSTDGIRQKSPLIVRRCAMPSVL